MDSFQLKIEGFHRVFYNASATQLQLPTIDGSRGIMAHHETTVVGIVPGDLRIQKEDGSWIDAVTYGGFAKISQNEVCVMVEKIYLAEEIDAKEAEETLARAKEELRQEHSLLEYQHITARVDRTLARLHAKKPN